MVDEIALARDNKKTRDIEREMDAVGIRESIIGMNGSPSSTFKLLREFKTAAQSFVDTADTEGMAARASVDRYVEWFRELLK